MFERRHSAELDRWKASNQRKPLILQGARQIGKTFLLKEWGGRSFPRVHYFNFERELALYQVFLKNLDPRRIIRDLSERNPIDIDRDLVIFDEIQSAPPAITSLKYFKEELPNLAIAAAGSLLGVTLQQETVSFPVGAVEIQTLYPLSFSEFLKATGEQESSAWEPLSPIQAPKLWDAFKSYLIVGGLPESLQAYVDLRKLGEERTLEALRSSRVVQDQLIQAYLADMAKHSGKTNAMQLTRLWQRLPAQLGRAENDGAAKFRFKDILPGKNKYSQMAHVIDWLEAAGLVVRAPICNRAEIPLQAYTKESAFKLFCFDIGVLGALGQIPVQSIWNYDFGTHKGFLVENFVAQELRANGIRSLYSWQEGTAEVEFVTDQSGAPVPIEVKSGKRALRSKSLDQFISKYHPKRAVALVGDPGNCRTKPGLEILPLALAGQVGRSLSRSS